MNLARSTVTDHEWSQENIPWLVNGTLAESDTRRLRGHLEVCEACRMDLHREEALCRAVATRPVVEHAPQAALARMLDRLDRDERRSLRYWLFGGRMQGSNDRRGAVMFLVAAQAVAVLVLTVSLAWLAWKPEPRQYALAGAAAPSLPHLQVIFDASASAADILAIVAEVKGRVIGGPSSAGVYLVAVESAEVLETAAQSLQKHPHVRFVAVVQAPPSRK